MANSIDVVIDSPAYNDYVSEQAENSGRSLDNKGGSLITRASLRYSEAGTHFVTTPPVYIKLRERTQKQVTLKTSTNYIKNLRFYFDIQDGKCPRYFLFKKYSVTIQPIKNQSIDA